MSKLGGYWRRGRVLGVVSEKLAEWKDYCLPTFGGWGEKKGNACERRKGEIFGWWAKIGAEGIEKRGGRAFVGLGVYR